MRSKLFSFGADCKRNIFAGIDLMYDTVTRTLGPSGQNVLIDRHNQVVDLTKDGVTVAEEVFASDLFEEMGCKLIKEAANKVNDEAGDGTTTVIVLAKNMCESALAIPENSNVIRVKRGLNKAVDACVKFIAESSTPVDKEEDLGKVAAISCQDEEIGGDRGK